MRIDIGANSIRPELVLNKSNVDAFELKNRGENVRGKVIDVNQNIVLVQTSTGKEFLANTVIPMENFIGEEMSFVIVVGSEGQIILKPELDEKKQALLHELKIEDILNKLNKPITPENKEIIKSMIQSGIAIHEKSFQEIKTLHLAMTLLQKTPQERIGEDRTILPLDWLVREEEGEIETFVSGKEPAALPKEISLKDIITLKGLRLDVNVQNLKALNEINQALASKDTDLLGLKKMMAEHFGVTLESLDQEQPFHLSLETSVRGAEKNDAPFMPLSKENLPKAEGISSEVVPKEPTENEPLNSKQAGHLDENVSIIGKELEPDAVLSGGRPAEDGSSSVKENMKSSLTEKLIPEFKVLFGEVKSSEEGFKISQEMMKELLSEIAKASAKSIPEQKGKLHKDRMNGEEALKLDVDRLSKDLRMVLGNVSKESEVAKTIEREILPKTDILKEFMREFSVNILPFQVDSYENIVQYYIKRNKSKKKNNDGITVAFSLETFNYGNVRAMLHYKNAKVISVDILTENEKYEQKFKGMLEHLRETLYDLGYTNISLSTGIIKDPLKSIAEDKIYPNYEARSFETWV